MSVPPLQPEYGADEIGAIVLDPGYSVTRAGFAGEDVPKSVIPSYYGHLSDEKPFLFDDNAINNPLPGLDIRNPMASDSTVEDWDTASKLWEYAITSRLTGPKQASALRNGLNDPPQNGEDVDMDDVENNEAPLSEKPLLMTEPGWNSAKNREKSIELAMESWGAPAFYLARSPVMNSFASGRPTALVVDIGASTTSVSCVHDGLLLKKCTQKSSLAGNWVSDQLRLIFNAAQPPVPLTPHYLVAAKQQVDAGESAKATLRSFAAPPLASFRRLQEERVLTEFKETCVQVWNPARTPNNASLANSADYLKTNDVGKPFEFPDGYNNVFAADRYRAVEGLFDPAASADPAAAPVQKSDTLPALLAAALAAADVDLRPLLLANVVVAGGSSLIYGLTDRVSYELAAMYPSSRVRIVAPGMTVERKYAAWIGGSILASLGSFHQMWISKKEYEENGAALVEKRCK
ncbi:hypothetical protein FH972_025536 [Carpinus fangiana]|uniref:Actin-related protein 4 n=1 Tax=Carpinus fangiana TaxID=176857 RepID=A0A5N6L3X0_9ROSI|nr:hypothetical protein FH972_025536 [Carpinus fangiana]